MSSAPKIDAVSRWQNLWGTPRNLFFESEGHELEIAFVFALLFHALSFGYVWKIQIAKQMIETVTLQDVDLIEPEIEKPLMPVEVQKPKSAFEFLKMALPIFRKAAEVPRDIILAPKISEPKIAELEKLTEKKLPPSMQAPAIKLDAKNAAAPKIAEIAKLPEFGKGAEPRSMEPALKLEEVGRKAVAPVVQSPAISLNERERSARDVSALPSMAQTTPRNPSFLEKLVEKVAPGMTSAPSAPLGYQRRDVQEPVVLDKKPREREVERVAATPVSKPVVELQKSAPKIEISKEKVKITGPLSRRKVVQSFIPDYPAWARAKNVEADVSIRFTVSPQGDVEDRPIVERTSGYPELDRLALDALKRWKFSPLTGSELFQEGIITFRFMLD